MTNIFLFPALNMLSAVHKSQIINSYSMVLADILLSSKNCASLFLEFKKALQKLDNISDCVISPFVFTKYKSAIVDIGNKVNSNDELQKFLLMVFKRRYIFLLPDIVKNVESKLQDQLNNVKVYVCSYNQLSSELKKSVENEISKQLTNVDVEYKINKNMPKASIDFVANGNICSLNLQELSCKFLDVF